MARNTVASQIIENEFLKVTVADRGAELVSVWDKAAGLERIWCGDPAVWNRHAPILFPFVGKVNQGIYRQEGLEYEMKTQHGFARDIEFECVSQEEGAVFHRLRADASTKRIYPFDFELLVIHRFARENPRQIEVVWRVRNLGPREMYYSIGGHPGFTVPARPEESREGYYLEFPGKESLEYILLRPETGLALPEVRHELKLEEGYLPIARNLFDRDALIFENGQIAKVRIDGPDKTPFVTMYCAGFPYFGIWSKPEGRFVCLEPWVGRTDDDGFAGELCQKAGEQCLPAGESASYAYSMEFHACQEKAKC